MSETLTRFLLGSNVYFYLRNIFWRLWISLQITYLQVVNWLYSIHDGCKGRFLILNGNLHRILFALIRLLINILFIKEPRSSVRYLMHVMPSVGTSTQNYYGSLFITKYLFSRIFSDKHFTFYKSPSISWLYIFIKK